MDTNEQQQAMGKIIARAWADGAYKQRFINDPAAVMGEEGIPVPDGISVKVVENTPSLLHLVLPQKPDADLSGEQLDSVAGGWTYSFYGSRMSNAKCGCGACG